MPRIFSFVLIFITTISLAQNQEPKPVNQTIIRLTIIKDNNKILMRETKYGWMTPAVYFNQRQNVHEVLDSVVQAYGIKVSKPNLNGLFTYKYEFKPTCDFRQLYTAKYESGDLPPTLGDEKLHWMPMEEAIGKLSETVQSLGDMTRQITAYPEELWGGSFILARVDGKLVSKVEENFYPLIGNKE